MGVWYYKARVYDPELGRFLQPDPIGYEDGPNMYAYVGNDPVNFLDPSGLCPAGTAPGFETGSRIKGCIPTDGRPAVGSASSFSPGPNLGWGGGKAIGSPTYVYMPGSVRGGQDLGGGDFADIVVTPGRWVLQPDFGGAGLRMAGVDWRKLLGGGPLKLLDFFWSSACLRKRFCGRSERTSFHLDWMKLTRIS